MGKAKCPFGFSYIGKRRGGKCWLSLQRATSETVTFMANGSLAMKLRGRKTSEIQSSKIYQNLSVQDLCVAACVAIRVKTDSYDYLLNLMCAHCSYRWWGQDSVRFLCSVCTVNKSSGEKNKRAFGEFVLHVLSKFEAWKIRDAVNENRSCCVHIHAAHTCCTEWEKYLPSGKLIDGKCLRSKPAIK